MKKNKYSTDYSAHDIVYLRNKEKGLPGWNNAEELSAQIKQLSGIFKLAVVPKKGQVLDLGCGAGNISFWLEKLGYQVTGVDVSSVAIEWAIEEAVLTDSQAKFAVFNAALALFKANNEFDIVLDNNCLHCIIGNDRGLYLRNVFNNLKSGGIYICNTMCDEFRDEQIKQYFDPISRLIIRNNQAIRYLGTHDDIIKEITDLGFILQYEESTSCETQDSFCFVAGKS